MNVVLVGNFWFPAGTASAARIRNLAVGLTEAGAAVHVVSMAPQPRLNGAAGNPLAKPREAGSPRPSGTTSNGSAALLDGYPACEGVSYEWAAPFQARVAGWRDAGKTIPRLRQGPADTLRWFAGLYSATPAAHRTLKRRIDAGACDLVIAYDRSAVRMTPLARLCRARGVRSILDVTEISEHLSGGRINPIYWDSVAGTRLAARHFDGISVISAGLQDMFRAMGCAHTLVVPAIEAWGDHLVAPSPTGNDVFRLTYVGALHGRDAPEHLVETVRLLAHRGVALTLDMIGHYEGTERGRTFAALCAEDPALRRMVRLRGSLSDAAMVDALASSDGLLLTRRRAPTEINSFPTRLVEYLRCGRPVLVSDVGDIAGYLQHGQEVFLLDPVDPKKAADTIESVVKRPDRGASVGLAGVAAGARAFDRKTHARRLLDFARTLGPGGGL